MKKFNSLIVVLLSGVLVLCGCGGSGAEQKAESSLRHLSAEKRLELAKRYEYITPFRDGMAIVLKNEKYGFIDETGKQVIPCIYQFATYFSDGLASVYNGNYGFTDKTGKQVIPCIYELARDFSDGLASVCLNGNYGFIDKTGKEVIPFIYDNAYSFSEGLIPVEMNGKWGYINKSGETVIPFTYDAASSFHFGVALVKMNGKLGLIDSTGKTLIMCAFDMFDYYEPLGILVASIENDNGDVTVNYYDIDGTYLGM